MNSGKKDTNYLKPIIIIYGVLLLLSWITQLLFPTIELANKYERTIDAADGEMISSYKYLHLSQNNGAIPVVIMPDLIHDEEFLIPLAELLSETRDVYIIRYKEGAEYTVEGKIEYTVRILDSLKIDKAHFLLHGYGSVTGLDLHHTESDRFKSVTLLSAFGISELHLLGNHTFNRGLYGLQYFLLKTVEYATPHFGWFYVQPVQPKSIRSFYSMDLRVMNDLMGEVNVPVLILHTENDNYVNKTTAEESYRLIPQSELIIADGNHLTINDKPDLFTGLIVNFLDDAESDDLRTRHTASADRVALSEETFDRKNIPPLSGFSLMFILFLLILFPLVSEDLACIGAGLLVIKGVIGFIPATAACFTGIFLADVSLYALGRVVGNPVLKWIPFRWIVKEKDLKRAEELFEVRGMEIIFASRFIPGIRLPVYLVSGMIKARFSLFIGYFVLSILIYTPLLVGLAALFGQPLLDLFIIYQDYALILLLIVVALIFGVFKVLLPLMTVRGRRKLYMQWTGIKKKFINN
jgi:membrane protein DedA with SNARE-associated domain